MSAKWAAYDLVRDHVVEAGPAELMQDVVRCVKHHKCGGILEANET